MKWYIVVKIFAVVYTSVGPFDTKEECLSNMAEISTQAKARYDQGERIQFMGLTVKPSNVKGQCQVK